MDSDPRTSFAAALRRDVIGGSERRRRLSTRAEYGDARIDDQARIPHIEGVCRKIQCQCVRPIMQMNGVEYCVLIRPILLYDH